jgi:hypothetical protein
MEWKIHQDEIWAPMDSPGPCSALIAQWPEVTIVALVHTGCNLAGQYLEPPPVGKGPWCWASSHSNLSFRTLAAYTMGLGTTPGRPPPLAPALLGNGLFLLLLG